ncbi:MAG TPA: hypothetical protein PK993_01695 [Clostridia bacterium]|jgi:hypothetical protein|nr:hypothetical protein [Clostridia bacterium]
MLKNEKGISLINLILVIIISLIFLTIITTILSGENGLINQWKEESNNKNTQYVIKTNDNQSNI